MKKTLIVVAVLAAAFAGTIQAHAAGLALDPSKFAVDPGAASAIAHGSVGLAIDPNTNSIDPGGGYVELKPDICDIERPFIDPDMPEFFKKIILTGWQKRVDECKACDQLPGALPGQIEVCKAEAVSDEDDTTPVNIISGSQFGNINDFVGHQILPLTDTDGDGVLDSVDNCADVANADQADSDGNDIGDACQDTDGDGIIDMNDSCPTEVEAIDLKSMLAVDGSARDGCPDVVGEEKGSGNESLTSSTAPALGGDGGCSLAGNAAANPLVFILIGMALLPMARWRRK